MNWVVLVILVFIVGFLLDREIYFYEGAHLGPRVQAWLYDRWAKKYDAGKSESQLHDGEMLARPLLESLRDVPEPFLLDFATGTGRLSSAVLSRPDFQGWIVAQDLSRGMLEQAASKLTPYADRVEFLRHTSLPLPFPAATFDAVACLEVLELLSDASAALQEMSRVLRPGGVLLTSRGTEASGRKAKVKSQAELTSMLQSSGFEDIEITKWWKLFDCVLARKRGSGTPAVIRSLSGVLVCSKCKYINWVPAEGSLRCSVCQNRISITSEGIHLN